MYKLHGDYCTNTEFDVEMMQYKLAKDPACLERKNYLPVETDSEIYVTSALFDAVYHDHDKCLDLMIKSGANIYKTYNNANIFEYCIIENKLKSLKYILNNNIFNPVYDINSSQYEVKCGSNYYLFLAAKRCSIRRGTESIELLLENGVQVDDFLNYDLDLKYYPYFSPTAEIVYNQVPDALKLLLFNGGIVDFTQTGKSNLNPESKDCLSLIHQFAITAFSNYENSNQILNLLHKLGANLWERNRHGLTPLDVRQDAMCIVTELSARGGWYDDNYYDDNNYVEAEKISEKIQELMNTPLSLQCWVRITLLRYHGSQYLKYVEKLKKILPKPMLQFLKGNDLCVTDEYFDDSD